MAVTVKSHSSTIATLATLANAPPSQMAGGCTPSPVRVGPHRGLGTPPPPHKGSRWAVGRRVLCQGLASRHCTRGGPLGPPREMRSASVPNKLAHYWITLLARRRRKFKFKMSSSVLLVFSFQARAPCPTGCSIRNFAFNTAE